MLFCIIFPVVIFKGSYRSAIVGWGLGSLITFMIAMIMKNRPFVKIKEELVPNMYKSIFNYSLPLMGASIVGMILRSADQFFISRYYGEVIFAEFSNGYIPLPFVGMITGSVASVLLPLLSKAESEGNMGEAFNSYNRAVVKSIYLLYPLIFFCLFFARDIMVFIYGAPYEISKSYFRVSLIKSVISVFPYLSVILAFGKSNVYFFVHLIFAIIIWLVDFILVKLLLPPIAIALSSSLVDVFMAISILGYIRIKHNVILAPFSLIKHMFIIGMHVSIIAGMLYCLRIIYIPTLNSLVVLFISGITFYVILILTGKIIKIDYVSEIITRFHTIIKYEK
jgi:O-antigen/teichoic acid export membrane protein